MSIAHTIPSLLLINLIAKGFKTETAEKVLDNDPKTFEEFAKRAESILKLRNNNMLFAYIEGMDDRQTIKLSKQLEASGMVFILVNSKTPPDNPVSRKNLTDVIIVNVNKVTTVLVSFETGTIFMEIDSSRTPVPSIMKVHDNHGNYFPVHLLSPETPPDSVVSSAPASTWCQKRSNCFMVTCDKILCIGFGKQCYYCYG